jgi:microcompartment protein CcmL/EutN
METLVDTAVDMVATPGMVAMGAVEMVDIMVKSVIITVVNK